MIKLLCRTFAQASIECGKDNGVIAPMYSCEELKWLRFELYRELFFVNTTFFIGNIFSKESLGSRSRFHDELIDT